MDPAFRDHLLNGRRQAAAKWLVRHHSAEVHGFCVAMVGNEGEDLAQDVFVKAFGAMDAFRGDASTRTWILAIARNHCLDHLRRQSRAPVELPDEPDTEGPLDDAPLPDWMVQDRHEVRRALSALSEVPRAMVRLRFVHGLDYQELAGVFDIKPGTARMRISRALARMRLELDPPMAADVACLDADALDELAPEEMAPRAGAAPPLPAAPPPAPSGGVFGGLRRRSRAQRPPAFAQVLGALGLPSAGFVEGLVAATLDLEDA